MALKTCARFVILPSRALLQSPPHRWTSAVISTPASLSLSLCDRARQVPPHRRTSAAISTRASLSRSLGDSAQQTLAGAAPRSSNQIHEIPISVSSPCAEEKIHEQPISLFKQRIVTNKEKLQKIHVVKKSPLSTDHPSVDPDLRKPPPIKETFESTHETHNRLQSIVGLVMGRDVPKSAFVFGLGAFILLSSSFTKDLNFRGAVDFEEGSQNYIVGEEAIWVLKLILPYFNVLIINMRGLFSADPATTMKLATLLFVLVRCGNSITIWMITRLGKCFSVERGDGDGKVPKPKVMGRCQSQRVRTPQGNH